MTKSKKVLVTPCTNTYLDQHSFCSVCGQVHKTKKKIAHRKDKKKVLLSVVASNIHVEKIYNSDNIKPIETYMTDKE